MHVEDLCEEVVEFFKEPMVATKMTGFLGRKLTFAIVTAAVMYSANVSAETLCVKRDSNGNVKIENNQVTNGIVVKRGDKINCPSETMTMEISKPSSQKNENRKNIIKDSYDTSHNSKIERKIIQDSNGDVTIIIGDDIKQDVEDAKRGKRSGNYNGGNSGIIIGDENEQNIISGPKR